MLPDDDAYPYDLNHVTVDRFGLSGQGNRLRRVLGLDLGVTVSNIYRHFIKNIVIVQLAEAADGCVSSRFIAGKLLFVFLLSRAVFF